MSDRDKISELFTSYTRGGGAEGLNEIRVFLASRPPEPELLEWLYMGFYTNHLYNECIEVCKEMEKIQPGNMKTAFYRANSHFQLGDVESARQGWQQVVAGDPNSHLAHKARERLEGRRLPRKA